MIIWYFAALFTGIGIGLFSGIVIAGLFDIIAEWRKGHGKKIFGRCIIALILIMILMMTGIGTAEETEEIRHETLFVIASQLNGRAMPTKKSSIEARFDYGDDLEPTGAWSKNGEWVEVRGGETGTVWVHIHYVTERLWPFTVTNENNGRVKIRSKPGNGWKLKGYVDHGKSIEIDQVVLGWGHCSKGWVDLRYFIEEV